MNLKLTDICGIGGLVMGTGALVFAVVDHFKTKEMATKIGVSAERLKDMTEVEVSDSLIKNTVQNKVDKVVTEMVTDASRKAVDAVKADMHSTIKKEVQEAVRDRSEAIERDVEKEIRSEVEAGIDVEELSRRIEREVERKTMDQIKGAVDTVKKMATDKFSAEVNAYSEMSNIMKNVLGK